MTWRESRGDFVRLSHVNITNHSRLQDVSVEVRGHLVVIGANDVGKSSLLRCLDLTLGASTAQLYGRVQASDVRDPDQPMVIEATLNSLTDEEKKHFPDEVTVDPTGGPVTLTVRLEITVTDGESLDIRRTAPAAGTGRVLTRSQVDAIGWRMVGANQAGTRDFRDDTNATLEDILKKIDLGTEAAAFAALMASQEAALGTSTVLADLRTKMAQQLSRATPTEIGPSDLEFTTGAKATDDPLSDVRLRVLREGIPRNLTEQSDGARALFAIALYDLVAESANIVAIDEPEIHLHPNSQRSLAGLLYEGVNQKIIATHSPDIVGRFAPDNVAVVRAGGYVTQPPAGFMTTDPKVRASWWVHSRLEPLTANHVVCVEGPSDRIIVMTVARLLGVDLDRIGTSVVELGGAGSAGAVLGLFGMNGFGVPLSLLIDEDARQDTADELGVAPADLESGASYPVVVAQRDLEDEYVRALGAVGAHDALAASGFWNAHHLAAALLDSAGNPDATRIAEFCRHKKRKVLGSIAIARALDATSAAAIDSVTRLLTPKRPGA